MPLHNIRCTHLPYCLERQPDGRWVFLNRKSKPIGFATRSQIDYSQYPIQVNLPELTPELARQICCKQNTDPNRIYLYSDGSPPDKDPASANAYFSRLQALLTLRLAP